MRWNLRLVAGMPIRLLLCGAASAENVAVVQERGVTRWADQGHSVIDRSSRVELIYARLHRMAHFIARDPVGIPTKKPRTLSLESLGFFCLG